MAEQTIITSTKVDGLKHIAEGKVRDLYEVNEKTLLFVASDRISAYDVIMGNVSPQMNCFDTQLWRVLMIVHRVSQTKDSSLPYSQNSGSAFSPKRFLISRRTS